MTHQRIKDITLLKIQEKFGEKVTVIDDIEKAFTDWFQGLVAGAVSLQAAAAEAAVPEGGEAPV